MSVTRWGIKITDGPRGSVGVYMDVFSDGKYVLLTDYRRGVAEARATALRDAVAAIEAVDPPSEGYDDWYPKGKRYALAAIEALGGER